LIKIREGRGNGSNAIALQQDSTIPIDCIAEEAVDTQKYKEAIISGV